MSASLVGSEMCIRDSNLSVWAVRPVQSVCESLARLGMDPLGHSRVARTCLLYTSDAADDM
eukprot:11155096-Alexandrium_andersonii.AAC.1